jgi:hypothetical protein
VDEIKLINLIGMKIKYYLPQIFSFIEMLKKEGLNTELDNEMRCIDMMNFKFRSLSNPTDAVMGLATAMQEDW